MITIILRDRSEINVDNDKGETLKRALIEGNLPEYVSINNEMIRGDHIVRVKGGTSVGPGQLDSGSNYKTPEQLGLTKDGRADGNGDGYKRFQALKAQMLEKRKRSGL